MRTCLSKNKQEVRSQDSRDPAIPAPSHWLSKSQDSRRNLWAPAWSAPQQLPEPLLLIAGPTLAMLDLRIIAIAPLTSMPLKALPLFSSLAKVLSIKLQYSLTWGLLHIYLKYHHLREACSNNRRQLNTLPRPTPVFPIFSLSHLLSLTQTYDHRGQELLSGCFTTLSSMTPA